MNHSHRFWNNQDIWQVACEEAAIELEDELGREPTEDEIEARAEHLIESSEPDWDSYFKDRDFHD